MVECASWLIMLVFAAEVDAERQVWKLPEYVLLEFFEPKTTIQLEQLERIGLSAGEVMYFNQTSSIWFQLVYLERIGECDCKGSDILLPSLNWFTLCTPMTQQLYPIWQSLPRLSSGYLGYELYVP